MYEQTQNSIQPKTGPQHCVAGFTLSGNLWQYIVALHLRETQTLKSIWKNFIIYEFFNVINTIVAYREGIYCHNALAARNSGFACKIDNNSWDAYKYFKQFRPL